MAPRLLAETRPVDGGYFPHLRAQGFATSLSVAYIQGDQAGEEIALRTNLVRILKEVFDDGQRWSFSFIGPLEERKNLPVLALLANQWPKVTVHISEVLKEYEEQAMTTCEIAFTAPHSLVEEMLLRSHLTFNWNLKFCGWLLNESKKVELLHNFKRDALGRFTIPTQGVDLAFASSDDWDCIEFFSLQEKMLAKVQEVSRQLT